MTGIDICYNSNSSITDFQNKSQLIAIETYQSLAKCPLTVCWLACNNIHCTQGISANIQYIDVPQEVAMNHSVTSERGEGRVQI